VKCKNTKHKEKKRQEGEEQKQTLYPCCMW